MATQTNERYYQYVAMMQQAADYNNAAAVLGWDQEVYMPAGGAEARARQLATLATAAHEILTSEKMGALLHDLAGDGTLSAVEAANVRRSLEDYEKNRKLSPEFVAALSRQSSVCYNAWVDSRARNDFSTYAPHLAGMVELKRQQAEMLGYSGHAYDALLDEYETGATVAALDPQFTGVIAALKPLIASIGGQPQVDDSFLHQEFPAEEQWRFSMRVLEMMGYDLTRGRQDYAPHPFTTSFSPGDVRITTRVDTHNYGYMLWSTIHEGGHALYEQGLPEDQYGLPAGAAASLSVHESQSRLWENCVGRSFDFWQVLYPELQAAFSTQLGGVDVGTFYKAINKVAPSFIRTEADELTYHIHVYIRYQIEKMLLEKNLAVADLSAVWNDMYAQYLGITPPDDAHGVLQDVHWSHGSFGYFPTYSTGSMYAAEFFTYATTHVDGLEAAIKAGNMQPLLAWLRAEIHQYGRQYTSDELCRKVTGEPLNMQYFIEYAQAKYTGIYALAKERAGNQ